MTLEFFSPLLQLVIDFPAAEKHALRALAADAKRVREDPLESSARTFVERRSHSRMAQQALGRHHDQRLAPAAQRLAPQAVEVLGRGGRVDDLDVVLGGQTEEALQAGAGVLGALPFEAVRQQQDQAAQPAPLVLGAGDELVDDHLGGVDEVAELGLPQNQPVGAVQAVAVLEAEHASSESGLL